MPVFRHLTKLCLSLFIARQTGVRSTEHCHVCVCGCGWGVKGWGGNLSRDHRAGEQMHRWKTKYRVSCMYPVSFDTVGARIMLVNSKWLSHELPIDYTTIKLLQHNTTNFVSLTPYQSVKLCKQNWQRIGEENEKQIKLKQWSFSNWLSFLGESPPTPPFGVLR